MDRIQQASIDQIVFGWSGTDPTGGLGSLDSSATGADVELWAGRLRDRARSCGADRPEHSFCYVVDRHRAAVLRRSRTASPDNRDDICHVLIGSADQLDVRIAMLLCGWQEWRTAPGRPAAPLRPLEFYTLHGDLALYEDMLFARAAAQRDALVPLLATALRHPAVPLTVVADSAQAVPLIWGLTDIMRHFERGTADAPAGGWTFSTYESEASPQRGLPHVVFLTRKPESGSYGGSERRIVSVRGPQRDDVALHVAQRAVEEYATGGTSRLTDWLSNSGALQRNDLRQRLDVLMTPAYAGAGAGGHVVDARRAPPRFGGGRQSADPRDLTWLELLSAFGRAEDGEHLLLLRDHVVRRGQITEPQERARARRLLLENDFWERRLTERLPLRTVREVIKVLLHCALDPDLADERVPWPVLSDDKTPVRVVHAVAEYAAETGRYANVLPWLGLRWMREHGYPVADPPAPAGTRPIERARKRVFRPAAVRDALAQGDSERILLFAGLLVAVLLVFGVAIAWLW